MNDISPVLLPAQAFLPAGLAFGVLLVIIVWSIVWKGFALWRAARLGQRVWFVVFLVVNTVGILEIIYLYFLSKKEGSGSVGTNGRQPAA